MSICFGYKVLQTLGRNKKMVWRVREVENRKVGIFEFPTMYMGERGERE